VSNPMGFSSPLPSAIVAMSRTKVPVVSVFIYLA
jgi:hypothetical protein